MCIAEQLFKIFFYLQREEVSDEYCKQDPDHKHIYRFVRTLFSAAQLTAECAIVTLVSVLSPYVWCH